MSRSRLIASATALLLMAGGSAVAQENTDSLSPPGTCTPGSDCSQDTNRTQPNVDPSPDPGTDLNTGSGNSDSSDLPTGSNPVNPSANPSGTSGNSGSDAGSGN